MEIIFDDNSNLAVLDVLQDNRDGNFINQNATVTLTSIIDSSGVVVAGVTFPIALNYVVGSNGKYTGVVPAALAVTPQHKYRAIVDVAYAGLTAHWEEPCICERRKSQ